MATTSTTPKRGRGRPPKAPGDRRVMRSFRLSPEVDRLLDDLAAAGNGDRTEALEAAIRAAIARLSPAAR